MLFFARKDRYVLRRDSRIDISFIIVKKFGQKRDLEEKGRRPVQAGTPLIQIANKIIYMTNYGKCQFASKESQVCTYEA